MGGDVVVHVLKRERTSAFDTGSSTSTEMLTNK